MILNATLERFFVERAPLAPGEGVLVAFSGGPDSTALLWGMGRLAARWGFPLQAAHLDHGMDPGSGGRAEAAARVAAGLGVPLRVERREVPGERRGGESWEEAGRRVRYGFLEEARAAAGARWIATAHHREDQAETVLIRLRQGSGVTGLGGIRPVQGRVVRPLLELPRAALAATLAEVGLQPVEDPTNRDVAAVRNLVRHRLLPALAAEDPELAARLAQLAATAGRAGEEIERRIGELLPVLAVPDGVAMRWQDLVALPSPLLPFALAALHRNAGAPYPAGLSARSELLRQLATGRGIGCDCGRGWRWERRRDLLVLRHAPSAAAARERHTPIAYTLAAPASPARRPPESPGLTSR